MKATATIHAQQLLAYPPERVWRALTDATLLSRWFMPTDFKAEVGHRFTFDAGQWGPVRCEVLALEAPSLLRFSWVREPLDTTVTWRLVAEGGGTRLFIEHAGFDLDHPMQKMAYEGMSGGWGGNVTGRLAALLAEDAAG